MSDLLEVKEELVSSCIGECHGTFGELIQGVLPSGRHFLVTLPINVKSVVEYMATETRTVEANFHNKSKSVSAVKKYLQMHGLHPGGSLRFRLTFPAGKGLSSSSADMVASIRATANYFKLDASPEIIESILREIEPTDGVMYDGVVSYYHREARLEEKIGRAPRLVIISADRGGECNTIEFNKNKQSVSLEMKFEYEAMLAAIKHAILNNDLTLLGRLSTRSSELSQLSNPNPHFALMNQLRADTDALGIAATHSGTCLGLLYSIDDPEHLAKASLALNHLTSRDIDCNKFLSI